MEDLIDFFKKGRLGRLDNFSLSFKLRQTICRASVDLNFQEQFCAPKVLRLLAAPPSPWQNAPRSDELLKLKDRNCQNRRTLESSEQVVVQP